MDATKSEHRSGNSATEIERFVVRIRTTTADPFAGLRGHEYIKARNLNPPVKRVQTSAHANADAKSGAQ